MLWKYATNVNKYRYCCHSLQVSLHCSRVVDMASKRKSDNDSDEDKKPVKKVPHWKGGLLTSMHDSDAQVYTDDDVIIIKDKYPKVRIIIHKITKHVNWCVVVMYTANSCIQAQKAGSDTKGKAPFDPRAVQPGTFRPSIVLVSTIEIVFLISFIK